MNVHFGSSLRLIRMGLMQWLARKFATLVDIANLQRGRSFLSAAPSGESETHHSSSPMTPQCHRDAEHRLHRRCTGDLPIIWGEEQGQRSRISAGCTQHCVCVLSCDVDHVLTPRRQCCVSARLYPWAMSALSTEASYMGHMTWHLFEKQTNE